MAKILITGGAGFIGSNLAHALVKDNDITIVDDLSMGKEENIADINVSFYHHDVCDSAFMHRLLSENKFDYIYYLAAVSSVADSVVRPLETHRVNQESVVDTLEYIRTEKLPIKKFLFTSSAAVYGNLPDFPKIETSHVDPLTPYAIDKYASERVTVKKWIKENNLFKIIYYKRKNGGKHRAINFALPLITSNLTMIIDSDDYLITDCSKIIESYWKKYQNNSQNVKAFVFEHGISSTKDPMVKISGEKVAPRYEYVEQNKMYGDYNDVFFTKELKEFSLPEFEGENFISEGPLYFNFSQRYNSLFVGRVIAIGNYGQQGLTNNSRKLKLRNYKGALFDLDLCMGSRTPLYSRIKHGILYDYITIGSNAPFNKMIFLSNHRLLKLLCLLPGIYFYIKDKIMHKI